MGAERRTIRDGIVVGLIGYAAVAVFYALFDVLAARSPLHTVNMLGLAVFRGLRDPAVLLFPVALDTGAILGYNALHLLLALAIGLIVTSLIAYGDGGPIRRNIARAIIAAGFAITIVVVGLLTAPMRPVLPWWSIVVANALAVLLAGSYLTRRHPGLGRRMILERA